MNKTTISVVALVLAGLVALVGCTLDRFIPVRVPPGIKETLNTKDYVTLRESSRTREQYVLMVQQALQAFDENIADGALIHSLFATGLETATAGAASSGGVLALGLTTVGALFMRRPGDKTAKEVQKEKEASYARGKQDAERSLQDQLQAMGLRLGERVAGNVIDNLTGGKS